MQFLQMPANMHMYQPANLNSASNAALEHAQTPPGSIFSSTLLDQFTFQLETLDLVHDAQYAKKETSGISRHVFMRENNPFLVENLPFGTEQHQTNFDSTCSHLHGQLFNSAINHSLFDSTCTNLHGQLTNPCNSFGSTTNSVDCTLMTDAHELANSPQTFIFQNDFEFSQHEETRSFFGGLMAQSQDCKRNSAESTTFLDNCIMSNSTSFFDNQPTSFSHLATHSNPASFFDHEKPSFSEVVSELNAELFPSLFDVLHNSPELTFGLPLLNYSPDHEASGSFPSGIMSLAGPETPNARHRSKSLSYSSKEHIYFPVAKKLSLPIDLHQGPQNGFVHVAKTANPNGRQRSKSVSCSSNDPYPPKQKVRNSSLDNHIESNAEKDQQIESFACDHCPHSFARRYDLKRHVRYFWFNVESTWESNRSSVRSVRARSHAVTR